MITPLTTEELRESMLAVCGVEGGRSARAVRDCPGGRAGIDLSAGAGCDDAGRSARDVSAGTG